MKIIIDDQVTKNDGATYKLRSPGISDHALYFTIVGKPNVEWF